MNSRARVEAALKGAPVDRPPAGAWGHTYREEWSPEQLARVTVERQRRYGWDYVNVPGCLVIRADLPPEPNPICPSLTTVWAGAELQEREIYDLFGVKFVGHPDLRRILLDDNFPGHPLRKVGARVSLLRIRRCEVPSLSCRKLLKSRQSRKKMNRKNALPKQNQILLRLLRHQSANSRKISELICDASVAASGEDGSF